MEHDDKDVSDAVKALHDLEVATEQLLGRLAYALIAALVTVILGRLLAPLDSQQLGEIGLINGAVAYYSDSASARVIRAMWVIAKAKVPRKGADATEVER